MIFDPIRNITDWIRDDWHDNRIRFIVELLCWADSLACSIIFNSTVPNVPFHIMYPLWIAGTVGYAWCSWSRGSFGMLVTFLMLGSMDLVGYIKLLLL